MAGNSYMVQLRGSFDYTQVTNGIKEIKKQLSSVHIGDEIAKDLQNSFEKIELKLPKIENFLNKDELSTKELEKLQKLLKELQIDIDNFNKIKNETNIGEVFSKIDLTNLENIDKQIKNIQDKISNARNELIKTFSDTTFKTDSNAVKNAIIELFNVKPEEVESKFNEIENTFKTQLEEVETNLINMVGTDFTKEKGSSIINMLFGDETSVKIAKGRVTDFKNAFNELISTFEGLKPGSEETKKKLQELMELLNEFTNIKKTDETIFNLPSINDIDNLDQLKNHLKEIHDLIESKKEFFTESDKELLKAMEERIKALEDRISNLEKVQNSLDKTTDNLSDSIDNFADTAERATNESREADNAQKALEATFGALASRIEHTISAIAIFNKSIQIVRNAIKSVEDLDAAFTQIAIVSEQSGEAAWKMFDSFNSLAKQYSITTKDLTEGAKLFYQQGLNAADTMKMVEASTVSAALGEVTMTEAANTLTAAIQGYNESAAVAMDYTDKIAMVGAVSAADFNELSVAMEKTASSAYTAGIDFDHLLGYLGKMIEVTREAPANLGTAMKTIIARFEDMKKDPMAILEDGVSANKVEEALATIGIALRDSEGEFRALQDVMDELGIKWSSLTRNQQAYIATMAAGSRQQSRFLALMNNYDRTLDLITESQNSAGAAAQQYATYQDSIAAAQARLATSWEKFYSKIVDNDIIKFAINGLSALIEGLSKIPPSITAIGAAIGALQLQKYITDNKGIIGILKNLLLGKEIKDIGKKSATQLIAEFSNKSITEISKSSPSIIGAFKIIGNGIENTLSSITTGFEGVIKGITGFIIKNKEIVGIALLVTGAIAGINYFVNKQKREYEEATKKIKEYNEQYETISNKNKTAKDLLKTYEELSRKISLTDDEQNTLNNTIDELKELYPELIKRTNDYGQAEIDNVDTIRERIRAEEKLARLQKQRALEEQQKILEKDTKEWKSEDISQIDSTQSALFFTAKDEVERNQELLKKQRLQPGSGAGKPGTVTYGSLFDTKTTSIIDFVKNNTYETLSEEAQKKILKQARDAVNYLIKYYDLSYSELTDTAEWEQIETLANNISDILDVAPTKIEDSNKQMEEAKENLERINFIAMGFNKLEFSDNNSIYSAQKIIEDELNTMFKKMDSTIWSEFLNINNIDPKNADQFANFMQEMLNAVTEDNAISITQLFKDFNSGKKTNVEFFDEFRILAKESGSSSAIAFANSFQAVIDEQLKNEKEKYKNYLIELGTPEGYAESQKNKITKVGEGQKRQNYIEEYLNKDDFLQLFSFNRISTDALNALEKDVAEAVENGDLDALEALPDQWADTWELNDNISAKIIAEGKTQDEIEKAIDKAAEEAFKTIGETFNKAFSIKDKESIDIETALNYANLGYLDENFFDNAKINENGELQLSYYDRIKIAQGQLNDAIKACDTKIAAIEKKGDKLTDKEKEQLKNLKLTRKLLGDFEIEIKDIVDLTEDLKRTFSTIEIPEGFGGVASENARVLKTSIEIGKEYENIVGLAKDLEKQMKDIGHVDDDIVNELLSYGDTFQDFFVVQDDHTIQMALDGVVENYADAAQAITDIAKKRRLAELEIKKQEMLDEADVADKKAQAYEELARLLENYVALVIENDDEMTEEQIENVKEHLTASIEEQVTTLKNVEAEYNAIQQAAQFMYDNLMSYDATYWENIGDPAKLREAMIQAYDQSKAIVASATLTNPVQLIKDGDKDEILNAAETYKQAAKGLREYAQRLRDGAEKLKVIDPTIYEEMADKMEQAGKAGEKAGEAIAKAIADAADAIIRLNELVDELKDRLKDIKVDYTPFTDIFEVWEHEWDYFYNIKRLLQQIDTQGQFIDNIISSDYATADQKLEAQRSKVGNILAKMAANDTYITALRAGMSKTAVELMEDFGEYYKVNPDTGQIYQTDSNLTQINDTINQRRQEIYDLQKLQNEKENDLNLESAKLEALEEEKDIYEETLSIIEDQIKSLTEDEDITVDISGLESQKAELEAKIQVTEDSITEAKNTVNSLEDEIQEIEVTITLKEQSLQQLENYVDRMEDKVSEYEEYWENLNSTIAEQQELLQELTEIKNQYIETAINTEQELYDAIVENYQNEINQKKKQYDYLKQLDNDYLQSIKDNINKERQAREDANKQKSYQQNIQRAQLLQMDTSGAYRSELASLNKEIESQRQELYDDLVDRQVEALEEEIEKRHELYDKEVAALEERLAYMQENAILLWEMVNGIVAGGAESMMAILENTTDYINSNELARQEQRNTWEYNVKATFEGTKEGIITVLEGLVQAGNEFIVDKYPEVGEAIDNYQEVFNEAAKAVSDYNSELNKSRKNLEDDVKKASEAFQKILDSFMTTWNDTTSKLTGYSESWQSIILTLNAQIDANIIALQGYFNKEGVAREEFIGSIDKFSIKLDETTEALYDDFIEERRKYRSELETLIEEIQAELTSAVRDAADAIREAADSISANSGNNNNNGSTSSGGSGDSDSSGLGNGNSGSGNGNNEGSDLYYGYIRVTDEGKAIGLEDQNFGPDTYAKWLELLASIPPQYRKGSGVKSVASGGGPYLWQYKKGGIADFTGLAWLDGTKSNPERVLSPKQTKLFESMVSSLEKTANNSNINSPLGSSYNIGNINTTIQVEKLDDKNDINRIVKEVENEIVKTIRNRVVVSV